MTNLIGVSGKAGHGKNTVGDIIQDLCGSDLDYQQKSFAGKLKQVASVLTGKPLEMFDDQHFKTKKLPSEWDDSHGIDTYRQLLQVLGTDAIRDHIHNDIWSIALFAEYKEVVAQRLIGRNGKTYKLVLDNGETEFPNWIITDVRFPNEVKAIKDRNGIVIRVNREINNYNCLNCNNVGVFGNEKARCKRCKSESVVLLRSEKQPHPSETALDSYKDWDYIIENNSTTEDLTEKVRLILVKEEIIS